MRAYAPRHVNVLDHDNRDRNHRLIYYPEAGIIYASRSMVASALPVSMLYAVFSRVPIQTQDGGLVPAVISFDVHASWAVVEIDIDRDSTNASRR
jgi:hypothetical protein